MCCVCGIWLTFLGKSPCEEVKYKTYNVCGDILACLKSGKKKYIHDYIRD